MYLTPDKFRSMGLGTDLEEMEPHDLRAILNRASQMVNAYCAAPMLPERHDFRGGTIIDEEHAVASDQRRFFFRHTPVKQILGFRMYAASTIFLTVNPAQLFLNNSGGYCEVIATQMTIAGSYFPPQPFWGLEVPVVRMSYTYGWEFSSIGEELEPTDAYEYRSANQFWFTDQTPVIRRNGVVINTEFDINHREGTVVFNEAQEPSAEVVADYKYPLPAAISEATGIIAHHLIHERQADAQLGNLAQITVEEVTIRRDARRGSMSVVTDAVPDSAKALLNPFVFMTVM